ncbi:MAG TPA: PAS domain S-box protein, partial [Nitrospira sp.]|nr:PAS domain S-box protein [Nitrospira sp.]
MNDLLPWSIPSGFLPHGQCLLWESGLIWLHMIADSAIVLAYYSIPFILANFVRKREDLSFGWMLHLFSAFIFACGTTHLMAIWTLWQPAYFVEGLTKVATAGLSIVTAILLVKLVPQALTWPSPAQLEKVNEELRSEIAQRLRVEAELREASDDLKALIEKRTTELAVETVERRRSIEVLRENKAQFKTLAEVAPVGIFHCDRDGFIKYSNERLIEMIGVTSQEEVGTAWGHALHPDDHDRVLAAWAHTVETSQPFRSEHRFVHPDGSVTWVLGQASTVPGENGTVMGFVGTLTDVTEDKAKEEQFRLVVESAPCGMLMVDSEGRITLINAQIEALFGYSRSELIGCPVEQLIPARFRNTQPEMRETFGHASSVRSMGVGRDLFGLRKDRTEFPVKIGLNPIQTEDDVFVLATVVDITERKHAERQLEQQAAELSRSNHELEQFAYVASHDLQEPLRMVSSYCGLLARRYKGKIDQDADEFIQFAVEGATRMKDLIDDLLTYSRVGRKGAAPVAIEATKSVRAAVANLQIAITEAGAVIHCDSLPTVFADPTQLIQVFQNLIGNALKFSSERPPVIRISACHLLDAKGSPQWRFSVQDNGIGFDSQYSERVFAIFQRLHTRSEYPGNGMGLAIVKKIVERHGGRIWVES